MLHFIFKLCTVYIISIIKYIIPNEPGPPNNPVELEAVVGAPVCPNNPVDVVDIPKLPDFVNCVPVCPNMPEDELDAD